MLCDLMQPDDMYPTSKRNDSYTFHSILPMISVQLCCALFSCFDFDWLLFFLRLFLLAKESSNALDFSISMLSGWLSLLCPHGVSRNNNKTTAATTPMVATEKGISIWRNYRWNTCHSATQSILCHTGFFDSLANFATFKSELILNGITSTSHVSSSSSNWKSLWFWVKKQITLNRIWIGTENWIECFG